MTLLVLCVYIPWGFFFCNVFFCNLDLLPHKCFTPQQQQVAKCYLVSLLMVKSKWRWQKTVDYESAF